MKLSNSELEVMSLLWSLGELKASTIADLLERKRNWHRNTIYTLLSRLANKKAIRREDPGYLCFPMVSEEEVQKNRSKDMVEKLFAGEPTQFLTAYYSGRKITQKEAEDLKRTIDELLKQ